MTLQRQTTANLQIRYSDDNEVTISGIAVPYGEVIEHGGVREKFAAAAFDPSAVVDRPLLFNHDRGEIVGTVTEAENTAEGLRVSAVVLPTSRGRDVAVLLRRGALRGLSVGFTPTQQETEDDVRVWTRATLAELSLTPLQAYPSAVVESTRAAEKLESNTVSETVTAVDSAAADTRADDSAALFASLTDRLAALEARAASEAKPEPPPSVLDVFARQVDASKQARRLVPMTRATSGGNPGLLPPNWSTMVRGHVDDYRYFIPRVGTAGFPASGTTLTYPAVTQHTSVAARGAESSALSNTAFTTGTDTYSASWFAGQQPIPVELVLTAEGGAVSLIVSDLLQQYAAVTDAAATTAAEGAATATGAALDFTNYGTLIDGVIDAAETVRLATGVPADLLFLTTASWKSLLGLVDADGRRVLSTVGASNADGSAPLSSLSLSLGGVTAVHNPRAATDLQTNSKSFAIAERPPMQLQDMDAGTATQTVAVLGALIPLPLYPAGILAHSV